MSNCCWGYLLFFLSVLCFYCGALQMRYDCGSSRSFADKENCVTESHGGGDSPNLQDVSEIDPSLGE